MDFTKINEAIRLIQEFQQDNKVCNLESNDAFREWRKGLSRLEDGIQELKMAKDFFSTAQAIEKDEL